MRVLLSFIRALPATAVTVIAAACAGTAANAQSPATTLLNVYEQAASKTCVRTAGCRLDFSSVPKNLKIQRVSCLIAVQTNQAPALISDFELGTASSDQNTYTFGQYLAPLELLSTAGQDQFYVANVATLHVVPGGSRPSILVLTRIDPSVPIALQCSIAGSFD
jgi:hypothetical protein